MYRMESVLFNNDSLNARHLTYFNCLRIFPVGSKRTIPGFGKNQTESFGSNLLIFLKIVFSEVERDFHVSLHLCVQPTSENNCLPFNSNKMSHVCSQPMRETNFSEV